MEIVSRVNVDTYVGVNVTFNSCTIPANANDGQNI